MVVQNRKPSLEQRAEHVETLAMLAQLVLGLRHHVAPHRGFYVMTVPQPR